MNGYHGSFSFSLCLLLVCLLSMPQALASGSMDFCGGGCVDGDGNDVSQQIRIKNKSSTTVRNVRVKQMSSDICAEEEKNHRDNLADGQFFRVKLDLRCDYHVHFKTTDGCLGNKHRTFTGSELEGKGRLIALVHACGSLNVEHSYTGDGPVQ